MGAIDIAPTNAPSIVSFSASPSLITNSGGTSTLSWNISNATSVIITATGYNISTSTLIGSTTVNPTTTITYTLTAANGNGSVSSTQTISVDTTLPTTPTTLIATSTGPSTIFLSWATSTDSGGSGLAGYKILRCAGSSCTPTSTVATSSNPSFNNTGLSLGSSYTYAIQAYDTLGVTSAISTSVTGMTLGAGFVQATSSAIYLGVGGGAGTSSATFNSSTTAGDFIIAQVFNYDGSTFATGTISDTQGNTFILIASTTGAFGNESSYLYYAANIKGGADTVNYYVPANGVSMEVAASEYAGIASSSPIDTWNSATASCVAGFPSGNITTGSASDILYIAGAFAGNGNSPGISSGWTRRYDNSTVATDNVSNIILDQSPTASGTFSNTFSGLSSCSGGISYIVALKNAALTISSFAASPSGVRTGATSTLSWNVSNATSVTITATGYNLSTSTLIGSVQVNPTSTTVYTLTAANASGSVSAMQTILIDNTPPSTPANLGVTTSTPYFISLSWATSTDPDNASSQLTYNVDRCLGICTPTSTIATTTNTSYIDSGLIPSSTYTYAISAYDPAGNTSALSSIQRVATLSTLWLGIIDPSRAADWTGAGIPGGIPDYTNICQTVVPSNTTGTTDMTNINNAIVSCGATASSTGIGQVVQLQAGTYTITGGLMFDAISGVVLRGVGPDKTKLLFLGGNGCNGEPSDICVMGNDLSVTNYTSGGGAAAWTGDNGISSSYHQGDDVIDVGAWTGTAPQVGDVIELDQRNDSIGICPQSGGTGDCSGVTGATESGTTVTITTSLPHGYALGECVGIASVGGTDSTSSYNTIANTSSSCGGYTGWFQITAVPSPTTFQYTAPVSGLSASGGGYTGADTGGVLVSNVHDATEGPDDATNGRTCPDASDPQCATGEISTRAQLEIKRIVAINGSQITLDSPITMPNWRTSQAPGVWWTGYHDSLDGIESLTNDMTNDTSGVGGINFVNSYESWVKNIRSINTNLNHVWINNSARIQVVDNYFFGTRNGAEESYGVETFGGSNDLVQNNICQHVVGCVVNGGDYGSVFSYNYTTDDGFFNTDWMMAMLAEMHDYGGMDLYEGNDTDAVDIDEDHGTGGDMTNFRNRMVGQETDIKTNPLSLMTVDVLAFNRENNFVGNVLGTQGSETTYQNTATVFPSNGTIWNLGQTDYGVFTYSDPLVISTLLRWGNYDVVNGATQWNASEIPTSSSAFTNGNVVPSSHALPNSFYLSSQPSFWTTSFGTPSWPAIGPDVAGGNAPDGLAGHAEAIPSQLCYDSTSIDPSYQQTFSVTAASTSTTVGVSLVTVTLTVGSNPIAPGDTVTVSGVTPSGYNGTYQVTATSTNAITYVLPTSSNPGVYASGGTVTWPNILNFNASNCYPEADPSVVSPTNSSSGGGEGGGGGSSGGGGGGYYAPVTTNAVSTTPIASMTVPQMRSLLASLEAELQVLEAEAGGGHASLDFTRNLTLGSNGPDVQALQHYLNTHGFPVVSIPGYAGSLGYETKHFGFATQKALVVFQKSVGILATGFFGPITRAWVNAHE